MAIPLPPSRPAPPPPRARAAVAAVVHHPPTAEVTVIRRSPTAPPALMQYYSHLLIPSEITRDSITLGGEDRLSGGVVYKGDCHGTTVTVQVSQLLHWSDQQLAELAREAAQLHALRNPNLVLFLGMVIDEQPGALLSSTPGFRVWLVTEFLVGGPLRRWLLNRDNQREDPIMINSLKLRMAHDLSLGLSWLHANNRIHGNLSSHFNLLLDERLRLKIGDFGLTEFLRTQVYSTADVESLSAAHNWRKKVQYSSPEIMLGKPKCKEDDVFSTGMVLYDLFWENDDFIRQYDSLEEYTTALLNGERPDFTPPEGLAPPPMGIEKLIQKCLCPNPFIALSPVSYAENWPPSSCIMQPPTLTHRHFGQKTSTKQI